MNFDLSMHAGSSSAIIRRSPPTYDIYLHQIPYGSNRNYPRIQ